MANLTATASRTEGLASDEFDTARGTFGISDALYRVGVPPLRPLPLETSYRADNVFQMDQEIKESIEKLAKRVLLEIPNVSFDELDDHHTSVDLATRSIPGVEGSDVLTLFIVSPWQRDSPRQWHHVVSRIKTLVDDMLDDRHMYDTVLAVEMIASQLVQPMSTSPVLDRPDLDTNWETIRDSISRLLDSDQVAKDTWTSISLFNYGRSDCLDESGMVTFPSLPTVFITFSYECPDIAWPGIHSRITAYLDSTDYQLQLHLEHDYSQLEAFQLLPHATVGQPSYANLRFHKPYPDKIGLGADICASQHLVAEEDGSQVSPSIGTLGCLVEVKMMDTAQWQTFGLTNYHVIRPAITGFRRTKNGVGRPRESSPLYRADHQGFLPTDAPSVLVESPSRPKHSFTISSLEAERLHVIENGDSASEIDDEKAARVSFFDQYRHIIGPAWAGSGFAFRTKDGALLDWALVQVDEQRIGTNSLPDKTQWADPFYPPTRTQGAQLRQVASAHEIIHSGKRFKCGAMSNGTTGTRGYHRPLVRCVEWKYMCTEENYPAATETAFFGAAGGVFAMPGDSGSIAYTADGRALGMIYSGIRPQNKRGDACTYVTPLEDVFTHIKSFLRNEISDIRVAAF
ncbi:hypothetical protein K4F52_003970 [Lecanicillium sp. MT-2017a]|nr:hypothetical protein K4F52_003970 [Lecanicillium sp. MT-2017a]